MAMAAPTDSTSATSSALRPGLPVTATGPPRAPADWPGPGPSRPPSKPRRPPPADDADEPPDDDDPVAPDRAGSWAFSRRAARASRRARFWAA
jgi:hypothetical protein